MSINTLHKGDDDDDDNNNNAKWLKVGELFSDSTGIMIDFQDQIIITNKYKKHILKDSNITNNICSKADRNQKPFIIQPVHVVH